MKKLLKTIFQRYSKEIYFDQVFEEFSNIINASPKYLRELNKELLIWIINKLNIKTQIVISSELNITGKSTEKIVKLCQSINATKYLSGLGGLTYLNKKKFDDLNLKLEYVDFTSDHFYCPEFYKDQNNFNNSIIDILFKYEAAEIWR